MEEIERLWFELQREMTESGKVVRFPAKVITSNGDEVEQNVVRIGAFNVVADGKYLQFVPETGHLLELSRQPQARHLARLADFTRASAGVQPVAIDPSRGQILSLLVQAPDFKERIAQGGVVGYVIMSLGALALVIALERMLTLTLTGLRVRAQTRRLTSRATTPWDASSRSTSTTRAATSRRWSSSCPRPSSKRRVSTACSCSSRSLPSSRPCSACSGR